MPTPTRKNWFSAVILRYLTLVFLSLSCALAQEKAPANLGNGAAQPGPPSDYVLQPQDVLQVKVFMEDSLTREISVSQELTISLPLIGNIDVRDRTVRQAEELIRQLYDRDFLVNPQVTLFVMRYAERSVNVMGMVNTPQAVTFPPEKGLTLIDAISRAGGFNRLADKTKVTITRKDDKGMSKTFTINVEKLLDSKSDTSWPLQVGDVVNVPENFL